MVTVLATDSELRRRAWAAAATVVDPEIPVLTIADLGVLRDVAVRNGEVEVAITPTYSGCPAMNMIGIEIELALAREGIHRAKVRTVLSPAWTTDWMSAAGREFAPRVIRRAAGGLSAMRFRGYRSAVRIRLDLVQGAMALQGVSRTVRLFQVSLRCSSLRGAKRRSNPGATRTVSHFGSWIASLRSQ
jgi:metal-sulfur cluster biosynthetic enzyme